MEIQTAAKASSSSGMQLDEQINSIERKTDKLSITKDPRYAIEREHYDKFINKAKKEINNFTQLIREFLKGSLKLESIAPFDVEILDIHWNRIADDVKYANDAVTEYSAVTYIKLDIDESVEIEEEIDELIMDSIERVKRLIISDEYPSLRDDLEALREEQVKWLFSSESYSDSEDEGMSDQL